MLFLDPLNPKEPALFQQIALPFLLDKVIIDGFELSGFQVQYFPGQVDNVDAYTAGVFFSWPSLDLTDFYFLVEAS